MREGRPSFTAQWVAACRGLGALLPPEERLVDDPLGVVFAGRTARALRAAAHTLPLWRVHPELARGMLQWIQLRTRALDDHLSAFVARGGAQVVLLGAGYDCRAVRLPARARFFEVDHPATQARKQALLAGAAARSTGGVAYVAWNFETQPLAALPDALAAVGLDRSRPTLTIWEGVTMYLTEPVIADTVRVVAQLGSAGSRLAFTYFDLSYFERASRQGRAVRAFVARAGEPWRFGWDPPALPAWLRAHGFRLDVDESEADLAARYYGATWQGSIAGRSHVAVASPVGVDARAHSQ